MSINPTVKHKSMFKHDKAKSVPKIRYGLYLTVLKELEKSHDLIYLLPAITICLRLGAAREQMVKEKHRSQQLLTSNQTHIRRLCNMLELTELKLSNHIKESTKLRLRYLPSHFIP